MLRRKREAAQQAQREHERLGRACYFSEARGIPQRVNARTSSLDALVDAGCSWELAHTLVRFPMLRLYAAAPDDPPTVASLVRAVL